MMIPMKDAEMELGNLMFGNSRGAFQIPREQYTPLFRAFTRELDRRVLDAIADGYENDTFLVRPYYWGEDDTEKAKPNFIHKPSGTEISWYKYPLRDAYCSKNLDVDDFRIMLYDCLDSLPPEWTLATYLIHLSGSDKTKEICVCRNDATLVYYKGTPDEVLSQIRDNSRFMGAPVMYNPNGSMITAEGRLTVWMEPNATAVVAAMGMDRYDLRGALRKIRIKSKIPEITDSPGENTHALLESMRDLNIYDMYPWPKKEESPNGD